MSDDGKIAQLESAILQLRSEVSNLKKEVKLLKEKKYVTLADVTQAVPQILAKLARR
ncbi:hypothetical protein [Mesorhizobium sp.]|uniref:hypothetical protein n=1 Tax=Mesorhizobium sp. TaxID=1871066 RepID=UPI0025D92DD6|nr:hypothetical protein [Mesorhizobium sp.]